jgi:hypothetical protein
MSVDAIDSCECLKFTLSVLRAARRTSILARPTPSARTTCMMSEFFHRVVWADCRCASHCWCAGRTEHAGQKEAARDQCGGGHSGSVVD